jgi:short subunit dehydrogenase-like uncharacterized protein
MSASQFLLYGANGYTGQLIARMAHQYGLEPILAGRNAGQVEPLARQLGLPYLVFDLNDRQALLAALAKVKVVVHAAGPFKYTASQMIEACLQTGVHYVDINGDISVFEFIKTYDDAAKKAGVMLLPGAGFDVVPTDCLALYLKQKMPAAVMLQIAFASLGGGVSHGTAMTMAGKLGEGGAVRRNGKIEKVPLGHKCMEVDLGAKKLWVMGLPWGDVSTAYHSTAIPNTEVYTAIPKKTFRILKYQWLFNWLLRTEFMRNIVRNKIKQRPAGPSDEQREKAKSLVWAKVTDAAGNALAARLSGPEGYTITAHGALLVTRKILQGLYKPGYQTPASAYGENLVMEIPGVQRELL